MLRKSKGKGEGDVKRGGKDKNEGVTEGGEDGTG